MLPVTCLIVFVTVLNLHLAMSAPNEKSRDMPITYPEPPARLTADADDEIPVSCKDQTYCTVKPKDYPQEEFDEMFKTYKAMPYVTAILFEEDDLKNKFGEDGENCESTPTFEPVYKVREKRKDNVWRTVVQSLTHGFVQRVRLETCVYEGARCFQSFCTKESRFEARCVQNYSTFEVLVASENSPNGTEKIFAKLPISCSCKALPKK